MKNETTQTLTAIVDRLGVIKAAAADLASEAEILKGELILAGVPAIDGGLYRATVSHCPGRETTDWKALAMALGADNQAIAAHTTTGTPYSVVRIAARRGA
jgi:hypothetical protein